MLELSAINEFTEFAKYENLMSLLNMKNTPLDYMAQFSHYKHIILMYLAHSAEFINANFNDNGGFVVVTQKTFFAGIKRSMIAEYTKN